MPLRSTLGRVAGRLRYTPHLLLPALLLLAACAATADDRCRLEGGEAAYRSSCAHCHDTGVGGAQVIGDREGWRSRLEKGMSTMVRHSIDGFTGAVGDMPPRGGDPGLSDTKVEAAVCYLVEMSR